MTVDRTTPPRQLCSVAASIRARILDACDIRAEARAKFGFLLGSERRALLAVEGRRCEGWRGEAKRSGSRVIESDRGTSILQTSAEHHGHVLRLEPPSRSRHSSLGKGRAPGLRGHHFQAEESRRQALKLPKLIRRAAAGRETCSKPRDEASATTQPDVSVHHLHVWGGKGGCHRPMQVTWEKKLTARLI